MEKNRTGIIVYDSVETGQDDINEAKKWSITHDRKKVKRGEICNTYERDTDGKLDIRILLRLNKRSTDCWYNPFTNNCHVFSTSI